jgi:hypothetical protein
MRVRYRVLHADVELYYVVPDIVCQTLCQYTISGYTIPGYTDIGADVALHDVVYYRGGSAVGSTLSSGAQGPGFEPGLFHDAHDVPVHCQLAV